MVGIGAHAVFLILLSVSLFSNTDPAGIVGISLVAMVLAGFSALRLLRTYTQARRRPVVIVVDREETEVSECRALVLPASHIRLIEVRENKGRKSDDLPLWQTYLHLHGQQRAILVHQRVKWKKKDREIAIATQLAKRWQVTCVSAPD